MKRSALYICTLFYSFLFLWLFAGLLTACSPSGDEPAFQATVTTAEVLLPLSTATAYEPLLEQFVSQTDEDPYHYEGWSIYDTILEGYADFLADPELPLLTRDALLNELLTIQAEATDWAQPIVTIDISSREDMLATIDSSLATGEAIRNLTETPRPTPTLAFGLLNTKYGTEVIFMGSGTWGINAWRGYVNSDLVFIRTGGNRQMKGLVSMTVNQSRDSYVTDDEVGYGLKIIDVLLDRYVVMEGTLDSTLVGTGDMYYFDMVAREFISQPPTIPTLTPTPSPIATPTPSSSGLDIKINFQPSGAPVPTGYLVDSGQTYGARGNGYSYGWDVDITSTTRDRNKALSPDQRYDTLIHTQLWPGPYATAWEIELPNGWYTVRAVAGDPSHYNSSYRWVAEGLSLIHGDPTSEIRWFDNSVLVEVSDGKLTVTNGTGSNNNKLNFIEIQSVSGTVPTPTPTPLPTATATPSPNQFTLQRVVQQGSDDAEQNRTTGQVLLYSSKLDLVMEGSTEYIVGIRFQNITIPAGATILTATLQLEAEGTHSGTTILDIYGQAADNPTKFTETYGDISVRPRTTTFTTWNVSPWTDTGGLADWVDSVNLAAVVQELINRPNWQSGNALAFIIEGEGRRVAGSFNGSSSANAPVLHITYAVP